MRIPVAGGAGSIGSAVVRQFVRETDATVVNLDKLTYTATPEALEDCVDNPRYRLIGGDVCDRGLFAAVFEEHSPDAVIHLAAESHADRSIDGPAAFPARAPHDRLIRFVTDRPGHDRRYAIDARRIRGGLGWRPAHAFEDGLAATIGWYLDHEPWWRVIRASTYAGARLGLATA